jgi:hypothetical protein
MMTWAHKSSEREELSASVSVDSSDEESCPELESELSSPVLLEDLEVPEEGYSVSSEVSEELKYDSLSTCGFSGQ